MTGFAPLDAVLLILAEGQDNTGPDFGKASPIGLLVVVLLLICMFFLLRSMNRHLKKVPDRFDHQTGEGGAGETGEQDAPRDSGG